MTDAVNQAIEAARIAATAQASQPVAGVNSLPATQTTGTGVAETGPVVRGQSFSMETVGGAQMAVDVWLKVKEHGLMIGDKIKPHETIKVIIDMTDGTGFIVKQGIKGGNPAQYAYTYDGQVAGDGSSWNLAMARIRGLDPKASPYPCVDLPMVVLEEVKEKDEVVLEAGKTLGYTTSTTNWTNWKLFYGEVAKAGLMGQKVEVELSAQARKNPKGNVWGVVAFKLVGVAPEASE